LLKSNQLKKRIAIFASGSGTNAEAIMLYFKNHESVEVSLILSNKPNAYVLERAKKFNIPTHIFDRNTFKNTNKIVEVLQSQNISLVVLAGFLWLIPEHLVKAFPNKIINIHPALLPKYGGKGMYGMNVHKAVKEAEEIETGITIHFVNEKYDDGQVIHQAKCKVTPQDSPETIAQKIHQLEHEHFPKAIESLL
jgi:phosphoribosylglycinamide formyltransferase-1